VVILLGELLGMAHKGGIYLLVGADRARKLQRIQALERSLGVAALDRHQMDGATVSAAELLATCRQQPAASPLRLIVVDAAHRLGAATVQALAAFAEIIRGNACVVLLAEGPLSEGRPLAQAAAIATVEQFPGRDVPAVKPFALTEALGRREVTAALIAMREQLLAGREPLEILGLVAWQVQRWVAVKRLAASGASADGVATATGLQPWQVQRIHTEIAQRPLAALQALLRRCWQVDRQSRTGGAPPELALEQLLVEACLTPSHARAPA